MKTLGFKEEIVEDFYAFVIGWRLSFSLDSLGDVIDVSSGFKGENLKKLESFKLRYYLNYGEKLMRVYIL